MRRRQEDSPKVEGGAVVSFRSNQRLQSKLILNSKVVYYDVVFPIGRRKALLPHVTTDNKGANFVEGRGKCGVLTLEH